MSGPSLPLELLSLIIDDLADLPRSIGDLKSCCLVSTTMTALSQKHIFKRLAMYGLGAQAEGDYRELTAPKRWEAQSSLLARTLVDNPRLGRLVRVIEYNRLRVTPPKRWAENLEGSYSVQRALECMDWVVNVSIKFTLWKTSKSTQVGPSFEDCSVEWKRAFYSLLRSPFLRKVELKCIRGVPICLFMVQNTLEQLTLDRSTFTDERPSWIDGLGIKEDQRSTGLISHPGHLRALVLKSFIPAGGHPTIDLSKFSQSLDISLVEELTTELNLRYCTSWSGSSSYGSIVTYAKALKNLKSLCLEIKRGDRTSENPEPFPFPFHNLPQSSITTLSHLDITISLICWDPHTEDALIDPYLGLCTVIPTLTSLETLHLALSFPYDIYPETLDFNEASNWEDLDRTVGRSIASGALSIRKLAVAVRLVKLKGAHPRGTNQHEESRLGAFLKAIDDHVYPAKFGRLLHLSKEHGGTLDFSFTVDTSLI